jgi:5-methylcytosine-specific restriction endonuclease McrA
VNSRRLRLPMKDYLHIAERDSWTCHWCGVGYLSNDPWEIDHVRPLADGGTNHAANLRLCHRSCNRDKGTWHDSTPTQEPATA